MAHLGAIGDPRSYEKRVHEDDRTFRVVRQEVPPAPPAAPPTAASSDYHEAKAIADAWNRHLDSIDADAAKLTPQGRRDRLAEFDKHPLDAIAQRHDQRVQQANQRVAQMLDDQHTSPDSVAEQLFAQRVWARDNIADVPLGQVLPTVQKLIDSATPQEMRVYADELPKALSARGLPADMVTPLLASRDPELGKAMARCDAERQVSSIAHHNVSVVRRAIDSGQRVAVQLVDPAPYDVDK
jgi:hypothetical protein